MKTNSKSLNDLFREASAEVRDHAEGKVLSQSEVERLIRNSNVRSVPVTIGERLYRSLLSTPLKLGMTAMTTAALIAIGFFAFWPSTAPTANFKDTAPLQRAIVRNISPTLTARSLLQAANPIKEPLTLPDKPLKMLTISPIPITAVDSLHSYDLSEAQLAKLGIVLEENGNIDYYTDDGGAVSKLGLLPSWGVRLYLDQRFTNSELAGITIQKSAPTLITNIDGAKRLFTFQSDSTFTETSTNGVRTSVRVRSDIKVTPDIATHSPERLDSTKKIIKNKVLVDVFPDTLANGAFDINIDSTLREISNVFNGDADVIVKREPLAMRHLMDAIHALDSAEGSLMKIRGLCNDSVRLQEAEAALKQAQILVKHRVNGMAQLSKMETDSLDEGHTRSNRLKLKIRINENELSISDTSALPNQQTVSESSIDSDSDFNENIPVPPTPPVAEMERIANSLDLSKLIPIRVVNNKNPEHPNVLIFWYDPTPEVLAAVPQAGATHSEAMLMQVQTTVYPNPTPGRATLHFELYGANMASYTIRNLLGQEVMAGGTLSGSTGEVPLDFSKLDAGVYLLVTTTNSGVPDVERVVVAK